MSFDRREKFTGAKLFALGLKKTEKTENERFELSMQITPHNTLAGCRLQPLGQFSVFYFQGTNIVPKKFFFFKLFIFCLLHQSAQIKHLSNINPGILLYVIFKETN